MKNMFAAIYRVRGVLLKVSAAVLVLNVLVLQFSLPETIASMWLAVVFCALFVFAASFVLTIFGASLVPQYETRRVSSPVEGRWLALNSPATKVPSHGVRMYGQSHAIDLVAEPEGRERPVFGTGGSMRPSRDYPAFGLPVYAMVAGEVVRASDRRRDHRARSTLMDFLYMNLEGIVREIGGPGFIIGNHVTIRTDDGVYATIAHLQRGSAQVSVGDRVQVGETIGLCGNSGNSSEPHVHAQLSDRRSFTLAHGIPFAFADVALGDSTTPVDGVPATGEHMEAPSVQAA